MILLSEIQNYSTWDGPGIRTTVFMKGCSCGCLWCQNPEALHDRVEEINGKTYGFYMEVSDLVKQIVKNRIFFDQSGGGVTFSGGNPIMQINELIEASTMIKKEGIHVAIDVYGDCSWETLESTLPSTDLYLYDIKLMDPEKHLFYVGVPLSAPLENLILLSKTGKKILVRTPIIPGVNMDDENIHAQGQFMMSAGLVDLEIFPYHPQAEDKYKRLGWDYKMSGTRVPTNEEFSHVVDIFKTYGLNVKHG